MQLSCDEASDVNLRSHFARTTAFALRKTAITLQKEKPPPERSDCPDGGAPRPEGRRLAWNRLTVSGPSATGQRAVRGFEKIP